MVKKVLLALVVIAIIGVCTGIYMWNKKETPVEDRSAISKTAVEISKEYNTNEKKADSAYLDKALEVAGVVTEVNKNQDGATTITLDSGDPMTGVQCTMRDSALTNIDKGQNIVIKGLCKGNNMGVVLTRCIVKK